MQRVAVVQMKLLVLAQLEVVSAIVVVTEQRAAAAGVVALLVFVKSRKPQVQM